MSCAERPDTLHQTIRHIVLPTLVGSMLLVATVAIVLGWETLGAHLGDGHWGTLVSEYFWITFWLIAAGLLALVFGIIILWLLSRRIVRPIAELSRRADELTEHGGTAEFPETSRIREVNRLAASFNRLFALQNQQAEELRNLIHHVLHDIRAPIIHISQQAEYIYDGSCDPKNAAGIISESCDNVIRLFETHAEIARNNAFAETAQASRQDLAKVIAFMVELYEPVAEIKGVRLVNACGDEPLPFLGHAAKLEQMIGNLIDNAIKFTPTDGRIVVSAVPDGEAYELTLSDTGIGIPSECIPRVFDRFFRTKSASAHAGSGLGLALVKSVAVFYRGTVSCKSDIGVGTVFTVRLPRNPKASLPA